MRLFVIVRMALLLVTAALAACGGGSGGLTGAAPAPAPTTPAASGIPYTPGVFPASSTFAKQCQTPRGGSSGDRQGSTLAENHWLRSWTNELYLWYSEVPENDPSKTSTTAAYFDLLKTPAILPSGQMKDRFHFTYDTAQWVALSQSGVSVGYGIDWEVVSGAVPRRIVVGFVEPGSVAAAAGITRGAEALQADGVDVVNNATQAGVNTINTALFPSAAGSHQFRFKDRGTNANRDVTLTAGNVTSSPVPVTRMLTGVTGNVGYLLFNDHIATAESALITAINTLKTANAQDLILDMRYNGGGYLAIASELAYMIAGPTATTGKAFERIQFNSKNPTTDPVTGSPLTPTPFYSTSQGFSVTSGQALPTLNLPRVYVLTSNDTCSASESVINGLKGAGVIVYQIGPDTCGKPYGFYPQDNCGTTYFSIQFKGVNELGFGDYPEGFSVTSATAPPQAKLPGCPASDDYSHDLGDQNEERLRVAITYRADGTCTGTSSAMLPSPPSDPALTLKKPSQPWRDNRIL